MTIEKARKHSIISARYERDPLGATAGVCYRPDQSGTAPEERISGGREPNLAGTPADKARLSDPERSTLAEIGKRLGRKVLGQVACVAKPDTILAWYRKLIAKKFDGSDTAAIRADRRSSLSFRS